MPRGEWRPEDNDYVGASNTYNAERDMRKKLLFSESWLRGVYVVRERLDRTTRLRRNQKKIQWCRQVH